MVAALFAVTGASMVRRCGTEEALKENPNTSFSSCEKPPCKLKRKTEVNVEFKFTPAKDATKVGFFFLVKFKAVWLRKIFTLRNRK